MKCTYCKEEFKEDDHVLVSMNPDFDAVVDCGDEYRAEVIRMHEAVIIEGKEKLI
jgi:hypothetical protein